MTDGNPYVLDTIEAIVGDGTTEPFPAVVAELHGDDSGLVGTLIATFTAPDLSGALTARPFLPDSSVTLSANEKYWFVLGAVNPSDGTFYWGYAEGNGSLGSGALSNFNYSYDSGTTWSDFGSDNPFFLQVNVSPPTMVDADFNDDGSLDCLDIDALVVEIATNTQNPAFDLTGDAVVDILDLDQWRSDAGAVNLSSMNPYLPGDANLDGVVDGQDFIVWNANKFTASNGWCGGDFNADSGIEGQDFIVWNANKFTSSDGTAAVPEPELLASLAALMIVVGAFRSRRIG